MIYLKHFILYSILGFTFESMVFKISNTNKHSGILKGPYTLIYGFGGIICTVINQYLNNIHNIFLNYFLSYILFTIICTLVEFLGGNIIKKLFHFDSWDYSNHQYHFGKYICLDYALVWGLMTIIFVKVSQNYLHHILIPIPDYVTFGITICIIVDFIFIIKKSYTKV